MNSGFIFLIEIFSSRSGWDQHLYSAPPPYISVIVQIFKITSISTISLNKSKSHLLCSEIFLVNDSMSVFLGHTVSCEGHCSPDSDQTVTIYAYLLVQAYEGLWTISYLKSEDEFLQTVSRLEYSGLSSTACVTLDTWMSGLTSFCKREIKTTLHCCLNNAVSFLVYKCWAHCPAHRKHTLVLVLQNILVLNIF